VGKIENNPRANLTLDDFGYVEKVEFPPGGNSYGPHITPPHSLAHTFKMKNYAPFVFRRIREFFNIDSASYMLSVCGTLRFIHPILFYLSLPFCITIIILLPKISKPPPATNVPYKRKLQLYWIHLKFKIWTVFLLFSRWPLYD